MGWDSQLSDKTRKIWKEMTTLGVKDDFQIESQPMDGF